MYFLNAAAFIGGAGVAQAASLGTGIAANAGFMGGAIAGGAGGFAGGSLTGFGSSLLQGNNIFDAFGTGLKQGMIGGVAGGIIGGIAGGLQSSYKDRNFWNGDPKKVNGYLTDNGFVKKTTYDHAISRLRSGKATFGDRALIARVENWTTFNGNSQHISSQHNIFAGQKFAGDISEMRVQSDLIPNEQVSISFDNGQVFNFNEPNSLVESYDISVFKNAQIVMQGNPNRQFFTDALLSPFKVWINVNIEIPWNGKPFGIF